MKTIQLISFCIALHTVVYAQTAPSISWQRPSGGSSEDNITRAWLCSDGSSVMCGQSNSTDGDNTGNHGFDDGWVIKLDASGTKQWQRSYGGSSSDGIFDIKQTADNGFIMAGYTVSTDGDVSGNHGSTDGWVLKTDNAGNIQWAKCIGGIGTDVFDGVNICSDNGFIVVGRSNSGDGDLSNNKGLLDGWIVKLDASGNIQWSKNYGGSEDDDIMDIVQLDDNNFVFCGLSKSANNDLAGNYGDYDAWFGKVNAANGNLIWSYQYGGSGYDAVYNLCKPTDSSGRIIAAGATKSPNDYNITGNHGDYDGLLLSIDETNGILTEAKCFGGNKPDYFWSIESTFDKGYIISGTAYSKNGDVSYNADITYGQAWIVKLNNSRNIDWEKTYGGPKGEDGYAAFERSDGGYYFAADTYGNGGDVSGYHGSLQRDYWAVRLSPCFQPPVSSATIATSGPACGETVTLSMPGGPAYFYHWYKDNTEIPLAESRTYTATTKGTYSAVVVNALCQLFTYSPKSIVSKKQKSTISPEGTVNKCADDRITFTANTGNNLTYKWYRNNKEIAGETGSTYKTKKDGKYYVLVTNTNTGCEQKSDKTEVINTCKENTARQITTEKNTAALLDQNMPNPVYNNTVINFRLPKNYNNAKIIFTDIIGKAIKEYNLSGTGKNLLQLNADVLSSGTYQYTLYVDGKLIATKKMIVIK